MLTYETANEVVDLTASAAFLYFPEISRIIDDYDLDRTVASCLEPVEDAAIKQQLRPVLPRRSSIRPMPVSCSMSSSWISCPLTKATGNSNFAHDDGRISAQRQRPRTSTPAERERADKLARLLRWREENPERVRELPRLWYARNKEKKLLRDVQRVRSLDPEAQWKRAEQRRRYESRPEVAERRRQRNAAPDVRARANARERLVRRLKALDLPPRRLTPTPAAYKRYYTRAADDFFTRKRDTAALARLKREAQPNTFVRFDRLVKSDGGDPASNHGSCQPCSYRRRAARAVPRTLRATAADVDRTHQHPTCSDREEHSAH